LLDSEESILHVVNYSQPFSGEVSYDELRRHLFYDKKRPRAIPYRTSYYAPQWGLCMRYADAKKLKRNRRYRVEIDTEFHNGALVAGEAVLPGRSRREIILTSYLCHPRQAHDGLSGVILLLLLWQKLSRRKNVYTYRFFIQPETIGSLALLARQVIKPSKVEYALVATCVGMGRRVNYKKTYQGTHTLDRVVQRILAERSVRHTVHDFKPSGSDERQLSSPGIRIPCGLLMGDMFQAYPEYHTSLDDLNLVSLPYIKKMAELYYDVLVESERHPKLTSKVKGGEPFLSGRGLYRSLSVPGHTRAEVRRSWILFLADGRHTLLDVAAESGFSSAELRPYVRQLVKAGLLTEAP
jgi:aminopeptidase-like protein